MHLRRALLLFAIVLGLAAVAATVSSPGDDAPPPPVRSTPQQPRAVPAPDAAPAGRELFFDAAAPRAQRMRAGQAATVFVSVAQPGQVEITDLGLSAVAAPLTPARFDVLPARAGRVPITFTAAGGESMAAGTLVVREPR